MTRPLARRYLLTGVTGFLGKVVLEELLRRSEELRLERVILPIRPRKSVSPAERFAREVETAPCFARLPAGWQQMVEVVEASLEQDDIGLDAETAARLTGQLTHILHAAASVDFGLPLAEAARANVSTTLSLLRFAQRCPQLEKLVYVSTAYVTPHPGPGLPIEERLAPLPRSAEEIYQQALDGSADQASLLNATGHPNTYTLTKSLTEHLLLSRRGALPVAIVRPSIISASRQYPLPGWIDSLAGFSAFVVMLGQGHMRVVLGRAEARLDLVPADQVSNRILAVAHASVPADGQPVIVHSVAGLEHSPTVHQCWQQIREHFRLHPVTGRRPALWYLGPDGVRARLTERVDQWFAAAPGNGDGRSRRAGSQVRARVDQLNRAFGYFTHRSFNFRSAEPVSQDPREYVTQVCRGVSRFLLGQDDSQWALAGDRHAGYRSDLLWALGRPHGNPILRGAAWLLTKVLRRTLDQVTIDVPSFEAARRRVPPGATLALVATHRSYLDFMLGTYLAFARPDLGLPIPYVAAATEFGKIPILGRLLPLVHTFYVARGPKRENLELVSRIGRLVSHGRMIEFYIEGTRSRTREFLPPKRGLIRCLQETGRTLALIPVAISFERVPEEAEFAKELAGRPKTRMRFRGFLKWSREAFGGQIRLGRVHLAAGQPVALTPESDLKAVSAELMAQLRNATVSTTWHLRTWLEHWPVPGVTVDWLRGEIERRGARVLESDLPPLAQSDPVLAANLRHHFAHLFRPDEAREGLLGHLLDALHGPAGSPETRPAQESVA